MRPGSFRHARQTIVYGLYELTGHGDVVAARQFSNVEVISRVIIDFLESTVVFRLCGLSPVYTLHGLILVVD